MDEDEAARRRLVESAAPLTREPIDDDALPPALRPLTPLVEMYGRLSQDEHQQLWDTVAGEQKADLLRVGLAWQDRAEAWLLEIEERMESGGSDPIEVPDIYVKVARMLTVMLDG